MIKLGSVVHFKNDSGRDYIVTSLTPDYVLEVQSRDAKALYGGYWEYETFIEGDLTLSEQIIRKVSKLENKFKEKQLSATLLKQNLAQDVERMEMIDEEIISLSIQTDTPIASPVATEGNQITWNGLGVVPRLWQDSSGAVIGTSQGIHG